MASNRNRAVLLSVAIACVSVILVPLFFYLDPTEGKIYAAATLTIAVSVLCFYYGATFGDEEKELREQPLIRINRKFRFPPLLSFILLVSILLAFQNLLLDAFTSSLDQNRADYVTLQVLNGGELLFGSFLPLSAAWASKIGFRDRLIHLRETILATVITFGLIAGVVTTVAIIDGSSPTEAILRELFHAPVMPLPVRGQWLMAVLTASQGILLVLLFGIWLWFWGRYGHWRFQRQYTAVPSGRP